MEYFVDENSIVRKIWGKGDTILFIFAGASAEFALNKAVDWLYFTGKLPADPLGRLFSTVNYARKIVFSENEAAKKAIDKITAIHSAVEANRHAKIPDWAYRDVLFMLIHYSIAAYEVLEKKLAIEEKEAVFDVFRRFGNQMNLKGLPENYAEWVTMRQELLRDDMVNSEYTKDLYVQYKKHLGTARFALLLQAQILVVLEAAKELLSLRKFSWLNPGLAVYKLFRKIHLDGLLKSITLPRAYKHEILELDVSHTGYK